MATPRFIRVTPERWNPGESLGVSPSCTNSRQPDGMGWEAKGFGDRLRMNLISAGLSVLIWVLTRSSPVADESKWCQSSGLFINWGWMDAANGKHRKSILKIAEAGPRFSGFLHRYVQICPIRLPHANLLRFHTILNIYYHRKKLVDFF